MDGPGCRDGRRSPRIKLRRDAAWGRGVSMQYEQLSCGGGGEGYRTHDNQRYCRSLKFDSYCGIGPTHGGAPLFDHDVQRTRSVAKKDSPCRPATRPSACAVPCSETDAASFGPGASRMHSASISDFHDRLVLSATPVCRPLLTRTSAIEKMGCARFLGRPSRLVVLHRFCFEGLRGKG